VLVTQLPKEINNQNEEVGVTEKKVVLIIASDLGFMCWLGLTLGAAGLDALPAKKVSDAKRLIRDFDLRVDVLVIDPQIEGAEKFAESLRRSPHQTRVIAVAAGTDPASVLAAPPFELWKAPPGRSDTCAAVDWVHTVESQLEPTLKPAYHL
jgi:hypothetical protein